MRSWPLVIEPSGCPGWQWLAIGLHLVAAAVPWLAGCTPPLAAVLMFAALAGLPASLRAIPGRLAGVRRLTVETAAVTLTLRGGREVPASVQGSSQAWRDAVLLRLSWPGGAAAWWVPRAAVDPGQFRRLKAAVRHGVLRAPPAGRRPQRSGDG